MGALMKYFRGTEMVARIEEAAKEGGYTKFNYIKSPDAVKWEEVYSKLWLLDKFARLLSYTEFEYLTAKMLDDSELQWKMLKNTFIELCICIHYCRYEYSEA